VSAVDGLTKPGNENGQNRKSIETLTLIAVVLPQSLDQPPPRTLPAEVATRLKGTLYRHQNFFVA
jgi:hypothetical protein